MLCSCKINRSVFKENIKKYTDVLELQNEQLHYSCLPVFTAKKKKMQQYIRWQKYGYTCEDELNGYTFLVKWAPEKIQNLIFFRVI